MESKKRELLETYLLGDPSDKLVWTRWFSTVLEQTPSGGEDSRTSDLTVTPAAIVRRKRGMMDQKVGTEEKSREEN